MEVYVEIYTDDLVKRVMERNKVALAILAKK